jgi:Ca2+-transporting ATPase
METELGHIAQMIQSQDSSTPLQIRLAAFGKRLSIVILNLYFNFYDRMAKWRSYFKHAVNVHLACRGRHSEALPALVTIALGAKRLAKVMHLYENFGGGNT